MAERNCKTPADYISRYPRMTAHIIADSFGYCTPSLAGMILRDMKLDRDHASDWVRICYGCNPGAAVRAAIRMRHRHRTAIADYYRARQLVRDAIENGDEPLLRSWSAECVEPATVGRLQTSSPMVNISTDRVVPARF